MAATTTCVFGRPITDGTRAQRARAALNSQNTGGKLDQALQFVNQLQKGAVGAATVSTTFVKIYNATGEPLLYATECKSQQGKVVDKYPKTIDNGQWAVFEHVGTRGKDRQSSIGAVVYHINDVGDSMIAWNNPWKGAPAGEDNTAYCEMNDADNYNNCNWDEIVKKLKASKTEFNSELNGFITKVNIDKTGNAPTYTACVSVKND